MMKLFNWIALISMLGAISLIAIITFWINFNYKIIEFKDVKFPVGSSAYISGGTLYYKVDYCKYMDINPRVSRAFVNGIIFATPETTANREIGCRVMNVAVAIPQELPAGYYHLDITYTFHVNPVRDITIRHITENFTIVERE